jgi:hypothetical protein
MPLNRDEEQLRPQIDQEKEARLLEHVYDSVENFGSCKKQWVGIGTETHVPSHLYVVSLFPTSDLEVLT